MDVHHHMLIYGLILAKLLIIIAYLIKELILGYLVMPVRKSVTVLLGVPWWLVCIGNIAFIILQIIHVAPISDVDEYYTSCLASYDLFLGLEHPVATYVILRLVY